MESEEAGYLTGLRFTGMETESSVFVLAMPGKNINSNMKTNDFQKEKKKYQDYIQVNIKPKN